MNCPNCEKEMKIRPSESTGSQVTNNHCGNCESSVIVNRYFGSQKTVIKVDGEIKWIYYKPLPNSASD